MDNRQRQREIVENRRFLLDQAEHEYEAESAYGHLKDALMDRDSYFGVFDAKGERPDSTRQVNTIVAAAEDRGYVLARRERNDAFVDYAMIEMEYNPLEGWLEPGRVRALQFEYDEMEDVGGWHSSRNQFYFDVLEKAGDRSPEEMVNRLSPSFTPDYDLPEGFHEDR